MIAIKRLAESKSLFDAGHYNGAYYLAGYSVECALKAVACRRFQRHTLPEKKLVNDFYNHDLNGLIKLAGLDSDLKLEENLNPHFALNWAIIKDWGPDVRYQTVRKQLAWNLILSIEDQVSGFMPWITKRW